MIDTHAHLNFSDFEKDYPEVIKRSQQEGVEKIINVGTKFDTSKKAIELANKFSCLYASVGLHPIYVLDEKTDIKEYQEIAKDKKVVAIGEIGLDYYHQEDKEIKDKQKEVFSLFLNLAKKESLPVILHCRGSKDKPTDAYQDILKIEGLNKIRGVIHCFTANWQIAKRFLEKDFFIGFTGIITFASELNEVVRKVPLERILTETDCPFLAPHPFRGRRNEPAYVKYVLEKIAEIKEISFNEVEKQTRANAYKLFSF